MSRNGTEQLFLFSHPAGIIAVIVFWVGVWGITEMLINWVLSEVSMGGDGDDADKGMKLLLYIAVTLVAFYIILRLLTDLELIDQDDEKEKKRKK